MNLIVAGLRSRALVELWDGETDLLQRGPLPLADAAVFTDDVRGVMRVIAERT